MKNRMKFMWFYTIIICLTLLSYFGCKKDGGNATMSNEILIAQEKSMGIEDELRTFYYFESGFYVDPLTGDLVYTPFPIMFCAWPKGNCLPEVTIKEERGSVETRCYVEEFETAFKNDGLAQYFAKGDYLNLVPKIDEMNDVKSRIINGEIVFHLLCRDSVKYYIGLPKEVTICHGNTEWVNRVECVINIRKINYGK